MNRWIFSLVIVAVAACGNVHSAPEVAVIEKCTSTAAFVIEGLKETEATAGLPSIEQFETSCSCAAKRVGETIDAEAYEGFAQQFEEAVDAYMEVFDAFTLYGTGDLERMAAGISEVSTPTRLLVVTSFAEAFEACANEYGVDLSVVWPSDPEPAPTDTFKAEMDERVMEPRLDDRFAAACARILIMEPRPEAVSTLAEAEIEEGCETAGFLSYHHYSAGTSERGKKDMIHEVEALEVAAETPRANWTQYQRETIARLATFVKRAVDN